MTTASLAFATEFMAFVDDEATRTLMLQIAKDEKWSEAGVQPGGIGAAIQALAETPSPRLLIVDLSLSAAPMEDVDRLADMCRPGTAVIALGSVNDISLFRQLKTAGVDDYLVKPVTRQAVEASMRETAHIAAAIAAETDSGQGRLVAVIGARGGVGASTIAINVAWLLAHEQKRRVVLADLDLHFGTVALALDLETGRGLREVLQNPERLDGLFIERCLVKESDRLFVLGAEESLEEDVIVDPSAIALLMTELRRSFDCVVVDLPRAMGPAQRQVLAEATRIAVVTEMSIVALRDTIRLVSLCRKLAPRARLGVIANRVGLAGKGELPQSEFNRIFEGQVDHIIPFDAGSVAESVNSGKPLAAGGRNKKLLDAMRAISRDFGEETKAAAEGAVPFWRRWKK